MSVTNEGGGNRHGQSSLDNSHGVRSYSKAVESDTEIKVQILDRTGRKEISD